MCFTKWLSLILVAVSFSAATLSGSDDASSRAEEAFKDLRAIIKTLRDKDVDGFLGYAYEDYSSIIERIRQQYPQVMWQEKIDEQRRQEQEVLEQGIYSFLDPESENYYLRSGEGPNTAIRRPSYLNISRLSWGAVFLLPNSSVSLLEARSERHLVRVYGQIDFSDPNSAPWGDPLYSYSTDGPVRLAKAVRVNRLFFAFALPNTPVFPGVDAGVTSENARRQYRGVIRRMASDMMASTCNASVLEIVPSSMKFYASTER